MQTCFARVLYSDITQQLWSAGWTARLFCILDLLSVNDEDAFPRQRVDTEGVRSTQELPAAQIG